MVYKFAVFAGSVLRLSSMAQRCGIVLTVAPPYILPLWRGWVWRSVLCSWSEGQRSRRAPHCLLFLRRRGSGWVFGEARRGGRREYRSGFGAAFLDALANPLHATGEVVAVSGEVVVYFERGEFFEAGEER